MSKKLFWTGLLVAIVRDLNSSVSNIDVSLGVIAFMSIAVAYHIIFGVTNK